MSSDDGWWDEDQGSREHQRVRRTSTQAARPSEHGVSSSQPLELEESSQVKTATSRMLGTVVVMLLSLRFCQQVNMTLQQMLLILLVVLMVVLVMLVLTLKSWCWRGLVLVVMVVLVCIFSFWWLEEVVVVVVVTMVLVLVLVLLLTVKRVVNFLRARMHVRGGRLCVPNFRVEGRLVKCVPHDWVLDSGAWIHHTSNLELLLEGGEFQEMDNKDAPSSGDDDTARHVQGRGSVRTERFDIPGVHYVVGEDRRNVVSVSQLARDHGLVTVFEPTSCHVKEKTGTIVGKGRLRNGMYILDSLRIFGHYVAGNQGASSGGERSNGGGGASGHAGRGNSGEEGGSGMVENRGGGGRNHSGSGGDRRRRGTGASRNHSGSGASGAYGSSENEIQEIDENVNEDDNGKTHQEINGNGEEEEDKKRGGDGSTFGESSSKARKGLFGLSPFVFALCLCIAASASLLLCTSRRTGVTILPLLTALSLSMIISCKLVEQIRSLFRGRSTDREGKQEGTTGDHDVQESPQEHNRRLFGLSRFDDVTVDPTGYQLPARAFPSSTNTARREEFLVDSGASFHMTWDENILVSYPEDLMVHTEPPTRRFGGIIGSIKVQRSGYLSNSNIKLDGILLAPKSRMNLVSVGQLSIQYNVKVEMDDEGVNIKKKQGEAQIGRGKMLNNHQYMLEYFKPGYLFAVSPTGFKVFGRRRPGRPQVNTVPCPASSTTTEATVGPSANKQEATESSSLGERRSRKRNRR